MKIRYQIGCALLLVGCYAMGFKEGFVPSSSLEERFFALLAHASLPHLLINLTAFLSLYNTVCKVLPPARLLGMTIVVALLSSYTVFSETPTVGASGAVFFLLGLDLLLRWGECYFNIDPLVMKRYSLYLLLSLGVMSPLPWINNSLHVVNFMAGCAVGWGWLVREGCRKEGTSLRQWLCVNHLPSGSVTRE